MRLYRTLFFLLIIFIPFPSFAAVLINEVAWMGAPDAPNDEWIELFNDGKKAVPLDGWTLTDNGSLVIKLAGAIGAGEFAVLERTDDSSAPGDAFLIYKGALSNQGKTLTLKNASSEIEDEVVGGDKWMLIGGDNKTKETAQRIGDTWQTAPPSPGQENVPVQKPEPVTIEKTVQKNEQEKPIELAAAAQSEQKGTTASSSRTPYYGLIGVLVLGIFALYTRKQGKKS